MAPQLLGSADIEAVDGIGAETRSCCLESEDSHDEPFARIATARAGGPCAAFTACAGQAVRCQRHDGTGGGALAGGADRHRELPGKWEAEPQAAGARIYQLAERGGGEKGGAS